MKKLVFLFCICVSMMACTGNSTPQETSIDTVSIDTIDSICND